MIPLLSRSESRSVDAAAIEKGAPGIILMENAGRGAAEATSALIRRHAGQRGAGRVLVVCGTGNNGGDGFVVARHLRIAGFEVRTWLVGDRLRMTSDARLALDMWVGIGGSVETGEAPALADALEASDVVVDALFGTGLDRPVVGEFAAAIACFHGLSESVLVISLDLPSGIDADTGASLGHSVRAHHTVVLGAYKRGLFTPHGSRCAGSLTLAHIGVPIADVLGSARLLEVDDLSQWVRPRPTDVHKTQVGHVGIIAGRPGTVGAALLSARGAMRAGAGLATILSFPETTAALQAHAVETMTRSVAIPIVAAEVSALLRGFKSIVLGPGLGLDVNASQLVAAACNESDVPLVLDADGLTWLAATHAIHDPKRVVLTPHAGEAGRLLGITAAEVEHDRFAAASALAETTACTIVLKGANTLIAAPDRPIVASPFAAPSLATAGSGDVLAGIIAALALELPVFEAAWAGVLIHARAGLRLGRDRGVLAHEIADAAALEIADRVRVSLPTPR
jgi:NAD(P)H-hydrate epimerase